MEEVRVNEWKIVKSGKWKVEIMEIVESGESQKENGQTTMDRSF